MGGHGSGRYKVLTDYQREVRAKANGRKWREEDPVRYAAYFREYRKKNYERTRQLDKECKLRKKQRMIEDAFERSLDRRDGFEIVEYSNSKPRKPTKEKKRSELTERQRELKRKKDLRLYYKNREIRLRKAAEYRKNNREACRQRCRDWYEKQKLRTPCEQSLSLVVA